jgi:hypothetical protein
MTLQQMIKFCDKKALLINDNINLQYYSYSQRYKFLELKDVSVLQEPHLVSLETTGLPFSLYLITNKGKKYCIMHDEKLNQYINTKFRFSSHLYKGTVFRGDLRKNANNQWFYYIHDISYYNGAICMKPLSERLLYIYDILKNNYKWDEYMNICQIKIRSYFLYEHLEKIENDTIIYFFPENGNKVYKWSKNYNNKKHIHQKEKTILAILHKTDKPDVYQIFYDNEFLGNALVRTLKLSKELNNLFKNHETCSIECKFNERFQKWEPFKWSEHCKDRLRVEETFVEPSFAPE